VINTTYGLARVRMRVRAHGPFILIPDLATGLAGASARDGRGTSRIPGGSRRAYGRGAL